MRVNPNVLNISYAIRDVIAPARELEAKGIDIIKLNIGDPVPFGMSAPDESLEEFGDAVKSGKNFYAPSEGIAELREAIAGMESEKQGKQIVANQIMVTAAVTEALQFLFVSMSGEGSSILIPDPAYPPYVALSHVYGVKPETYKTSDEYEWQPDIDDMRKRITESTQAIAIINPNNPTGALYNKKTVKEIVDLAGEFNLPIISDEIYDLIVYDKKFVSPVKVSDDVPVIVLNGASKGYFATGWRLGYMYFYDPQNKLDNLWEAVNKLARLRLCASTPAQYAFLSAVQHNTAIKQNLIKLRERRDFAYKRLNEIDGIDVVKPEGAFYIFPRINLGNEWKDDKDFVLDFLKTEHVLLVHGSGFGNQGKGHFRAVFLPPVKTLNTAFDRLENFIKMRRNQ